MMCGAVPSPSLTCGSMNATHTGLRSTNSTSCARAHCLRLQGTATARTCIEALRVAGRTYLTREGDEGGGRDSATSPSCPNSSQVGSSQEGSSGRRNNPS